VIKIPQIGNHIYVSNYIGENLREVIIMNESLPLASTPEKIIPVGFTRERKKGLEFFKEFVVDENLHSIAEVLTFSTQGVHGARRCYGGSREVYTSKA